MATMTGQAYSAAALHAWIEDLIERGMEPKEAMRHVHGEIAKDPDEATRWWEALGIVCVKKAYAAATKRESSSGGTPAATTAATAAAPRAPRPSWRLRAGVNPLDIEVPVGRRSKRIGDFTRDDIDVVWRQYHASSLHMVEHARRWKRLGQELQPGETIQGALGRLDRKEVDALAQHLGADAERFHSVRG
jgi:hypothetical protein